MSQTDKTLLFLVFVVLLLGFLVLQGLGVINVWAWALS